MRSGRPKIIIVIPRGESVRNFLYSDFIRILHNDANVIVLTVTDDDDFLQHFSRCAEEIVKIDYYPESQLLGYLRKLIHDAHFRWLWSEVAKNRWETDDAEAFSLPEKIKRLFTKCSLIPFSNRPALETLTRLEQYLTYKLRPTDKYDKLFADLQPDLLFNGSHIHGPAGSLPVRVAHKMGIPTAGFIFSWDNLTSRSRILEPYDYYFVWNEAQKRLLKSIYPRIDSARIFPEGTPQFDFHFKPDNLLSREELCRRTGIDPARPYILYTAGIDRHFPQEHLHLQTILKIIQELDFNPRPQLAVRMYVKGISKEMQALSQQPNPDMVFPPILWEERWKTPKYEDLGIYSSLLKHCAFGINAASTVSLELLIFDKPIMNLGFDPPGSNLPHHLRWARHIAFDHFKSVAESGAVMVARSAEDMKRMLKIALENPLQDSPKRQSFINTFFDGRLDGKAAERIARRLLELALRKKD